MNAADHYDVIVTGVGSMGAAACWYLAKRNCKVLGLEQFDIPHEQGSHAGQSRICLLYTSPSPRDGLLSRMPSSA